MSYDQMITLCITSFDRFDLLQQTIETFLGLNAHPNLIKRIAIIEDSTKPYMQTNILKKFGHKVDLIFNDIRVGQAPSIDKIYNTVDTKYIFHTEDDYQYIGNPNFLKESVEILEERGDIHQIWIRHFNNFYVSHGPRGLLQFENEILKSTSGIDYKMLKANHDGGWCGFSWNPGLRRTDDYHKMFPNGYGEYIDPNHMHSGVQTEARCNNRARECGYRAAILINGACNNVGVGRATYK